MLHSVDQWQCEQCGTMNMELRSKCRTCQKPKPEKKETEMVDSTEFGYFRGKKQYQYYHRYWDGIDKPEYTNHHPINTDDGLILDMLHGGTERTEDPLLEAIKERYGDVVRALGARIRDHLKSGLTKDGDLLLYEDDNRWLEDMLNNANDVEIEAAAPPKTAGRDEQLARMVDRFLSWRLPTSFSPDGGISFTRVTNPGTPQEYTYAPVGTNLFSATEAKEMIKHILEGERL